MNELHPAVRSAIETQGAALVVHDHSAFSIEIKSPADFSAAVGLPLERITKSLFLRRDDGRHLVAVLGMNQRVDFKQLARAIEAKHVEVASPDELQSILGFPRNGVSPIGVPSNVQVVMEAGLLDHETVTVGGGATGVEAELQPTDIRLLSEAIVAEFAAAQPR